MSRTKSGRAERWRIQRADGLPFCPAGIWEAWHRDKDTLWSYSMITINADTHPLMRRFHKPGEEKRCVVVLPTAHYRDGLYAGPRQARDLLQAFPAEEISADPAVQIRHNLANI